MSMLGSCTCTSPVCVCRVPSLPSAHFPEKQAHHREGTGQTCPTPCCCFAPVEAGGANTREPFASPREAHGHMKETPMAPSDARHKELVPSANLSASSSASLVLSPPRGRAPGSVHRQPHPHGWAPTRLPISAPAGTAGTSLPDFLFQPPLSQPSVVTVVGR